MRLLTRLLCVFILTSPALPIGSVSSLAAVYKCPGSPPRYTDTPDNEDCRRLDPQDMGISTAPGSSSGSERVQERRKTEVETIIRAHCVKRWPRNFRMQAYCEEQQFEALRDLGEGRPADISSHDYGIILNECAGKWGENFRMRDYCHNQQYEAVRKLRR